jgi:hypothetical protein
MPSNMPTQEMAYGGLAELDTNDMYDENSFAGGGIIAFANRGLVEDPNDPYKKQRGYDADTGLDAYGRMLEKRLAEKASRGKKGLAGLEIEDTPATKGLMQSIFGSGMYGIDSSGTPSMTPAGELSVEKARLEEKIKTPSESTYGDIERLKQIESALSNSSSRLDTSIKGGFTPTMEDLTPKPTPTPTPPPKNAGLGSFGIKPYAEKTQEQVMDEINKSRTLAGVESTELINSLRTNFWLSFKLTYLPLSFSNSTLYVNIRRSLSYDLNSSSKLSFTCFSLTSLLVKVSSKDILLVII